jgi:hypothetical protein
MSAIDGKADVIGAFLFSSEIIVLRQFCRDFGAGVCQLQAPIGQVTSLTELG